MSKIVEILNRKARRDYEVHDTYEAGIELKGTEVKSLRAGQANLQDAFARVEKGEIWLYHFHIPPYEQASIENHDPKRIRRLLLNRHEIRKIFGDTSIKGQSLIPMRGYFKKNRFKIELAVCSGKHNYDKRQDIKKRDTERELRRNFK